MQQCPKCLSYDSYRYDNHTSVCKHCDNKYEDEFEGQEYEIDTDTLRILSGADRVSGESVIKGKVIVVEDYFRNAADTIDRLREEIHLLKIQPDIEHLESLIYNEEHDNRYKKIGEQFGYVTGVSDYVELGIYKEVREQWYERIADTRTVIMKKIQELKENK